MPIPDRIIANGHNDGDSTGRFSRRLDRIRVSDDNIDVHTDEVVGEVAVLLGPALRRAILDQNIAAYFITLLLQPLPERIHIVRWRRAPKEGRTRREDLDPRHSRWWLPRQPSTPRQQPEASYSRALYELAAAEAAPAAW